MRSTDQSVPALHRAYRSFLSKTTLLTTTMLASASLNVMANHVVSVPTTGDCAADTVGQSLNCTSNDVTIALVTALDAATKCIHGEIATLTLETEMQINAAASRHDIAAWIPTTDELGKNMLLTSANGGPESCQSKAFHEPIYADGNPTLLLVDDLDGDLCGDVNGVNSTFTREFTDADVGCDGTVGGAEVDAIVSWHLSGNDPACNVHQDYGGFKKSKCSNTTSFVDLIVVGKLEVCKAAAVGTDIDFEFTINQGIVWVDGTGADDVPSVADSPFSLNPIGGLECVTFNVLTAQGDDLNEVNIQETSITEGWGVSDVSCINNADGGAPAAFTDNGDGFTIGLTEGNLGEGGDDPGQPDVTCTITNTQGGSITIIKDAVPNGEQDFTFTGNLGMFSLDDDGNGGLPNSITFDNLADGDYNVTETVTPGFDLTGIQCTATDGSSVNESVGNRKADITLSQGGEVICTFTNTQRGEIRVSKETFPADDPTEFDFSGDLVGSIVNGEHIALEVMPGAYNATETVPDGWDLVSITCNDGDSTGDTGTATASFNVEAGEAVNCVFTNVKQGSIAVEKVANGGDDTLLFTPSWSEPFEIGTVDGSGGLAFNNLPASDEVIEDTYAVNEDMSGLVAARWNFDGVVCTGDDGVEDNNAIDLDPGETVTCVFTNIKYARITVRKEALGPDDSFCFLINQPNTGNVDCLETENGEAQEGGDNLLTGSWSIVEQVEVPWILADATCDNGYDPSGFILEPGDDITCTFRNVLPAPVPVNNTLALLLMLLTVLATAWYFRPARSIQQA